MGIMIPCAKDEIARMTAASGGQREGHPESSCDGMAVGQRRAEDHTQDVPDIILDRVSVCAGDSARCLKSVVLLVDPFVQRSPMQEVVCRVKPNVDDESAAYKVEECNLEIEMITESWSRGAAAQPSITLKECISGNSDQPGEDEKVQERHANGLEPLFHAEVALLPLNLPLKRETLRQYIEKRAKASAEEKISQQSAYNLNIESVIDGRVIEGKGLPNDPCK